MSEAQPILEKLIAWASSDPKVRGLLLVGSRARRADPDDLADFDVQVYTHAIAAYTGERGWMEAIGRVWVCVPDEYDDGGLRVPTRLVIFEHGVKVDFAFYPTGKISEGVRGGRPHRVLLDKDDAGFSRAGEAALPRQGEAPGAQAFSRVVEEFWFEAYHVAKYLARDELYLAKTRDWATKQFLLTMIDWHGRIVGGRPHHPDFEGARAHIDASTWQALQLSFAGPGRLESFSALFETMSLFGRLASEVAAAAGLVYPADLDANLSGLIRGLRDRRPGP